MPIHHQPNLRDLVRDGLPAKGDLKRSILVSGKVSSVSLEQEFWDAFRDIAASKGLKLSGLATAIQQELNGRPNLSAGIRIYVLNYYQSRASDPLERAKPRLKDRQRDQRCTK
jgi:predicted DNA-binding ribbon-helix-helix protein